MTCQDCGLEIPEEHAGAGLLQVEYKCIELTGRCVGCEFIRGISKGETDDRGTSDHSTTDV